MAKKGAANAASEVRAPGAAPSAETAAPAEADEPGESAAAAETDPARLSLDALSLETNPGPGRDRPIDGSDGAPVDATGALPAGAGPRGAYPGGAVPYDAYGNPAGSPGMHPQVGMPGMPGMMSPGMMSPGMMSPGMMSPEMMSPEMISPEMAMQQQHAAMLYHQQADPAVLYAYYSRFAAAAESGDPRAAEALSSTRDFSEATRATASGATSAAPADGSGTAGAGPDRRAEAALGPASSFSAEMFAAQMHRLAQMGAHPTHVHPMWGGAHAPEWDGGAARHQQWQHAGYARAWGAHDAAAGAAAGAYGVPYAPRYEGDGAFRWKPPTPRGVRVRREHGQNGRNDSARARGHADRTRLRGATNGWNERRTARDGARTDARRDRRGARGGVSDGDAKPASAFLEAFKRNAKSRDDARPSLADVAGHVVEFSRDQHGSRCVQRGLESATSEEIAAALEEVLPEATDLAADVFGNYVAQKFFECGDAAARAKLGARLEGHVLELSLHAYGCRVVQKALETLDENTKATLAAELDGNVLRCVRDQNGNHVVQKCVEQVHVSRLGFIVSALAGNVASLSAHPYGCRVIQRALERCAPYHPELDADGNAVAAADASAETAVRFSTLEILRDAAALARDQYGNYVVQHVLQHGDDVSRKSVLATLAGQIVPLAQHKFASNVVEKCLTYCGAEEREIMIGEILGDSVHRAASRDAEQGASPSGSAPDAQGPHASPVAPVPPLQAMMKDQFANYVVQKLLEVCDDDQRERLLASARAHLQAVKKVPYGKNIVARVEKLVVENGAQSGVKADARGAAEVENAPGEKRAGDGGEESGG